MDEKNHLILVKSAGVFVDKTRSIESILKSGDKYSVSYQNTLKPYNYNDRNIQYYHSPQNLDLNGLVIRIKGGLPTKWDAAIVFDKYVRLIRGSSARLEKFSDIELLENLSEQEGAGKIISYYCELAKIIEEFNPDFSYLSKYYTEKLGHLQPESVAYRYVTSGELNTSQTPPPPLFPFGINPSQRQAVFNTLENQLSLIQGPPGTGKTQTILNIIVNLIVQGKSVAVVAGNNSAVANVYEKLEKSGFGFIAARLGSSAQQKSFFDSNLTVPNISTWKLTSEEAELHTLELKNTSDLITKLLDDNNRLSILKESHERLKVERGYFNKHFDIFPINMKSFSIFNRWKASNILTFMADYEHHSQYGKLSLKQRFKWLLKYGIYNFSAFKELDDETFKGIMSEYYEAKFVELVDEITCLEKFLRENDFNATVENLTNISLSLFKHFIYEKFHLKSSTGFTSRSYKDNFKDFLGRFPIILSTTDSIINNKPVSDLFDYIIVDEASQVNLLAGFLTMSSAKNMVVVGDLKQIPHITDPAIDSVIDESLNIPGEYSYFNESLLSSIAKVFPDASNTLLREHYRCHPRIIDFCNQKYYDGQLIIMTTGKDEPFKILKTVEGNHARRPLSGNGYINVRELDVIKNEVLNEELKRRSGDNIGIISPYRAQANEAAKRIDLGGVVADTVHKFQGREKECIIFSTAANKLTSYMDDPNVLNVAVSRAQNKFVMVTSPSVLKKHGSNIGDLLRHIEYQTLDSCIFESKTISVFDCLYKEYSEALNDFRKTVGKKSDYLSENLMIAVLNGILEEEKYRSFSYQRDYALHLLVKDFSLLNEEEHKFASHSYSHIDFLIYNKLDMQPILAIEVDGYQYHELDAKQKRRDKIKDSIMEKLSIPLLRLSTTESGEQERVIAELNKIIE